MQSPARAAALLSWYDRHRRALPWRARPGEQPDAYRVWLSEIMLQQTTVKAVAPYFVRFVQRWPMVHALAAAPLDDVLRLWAGLGYYARARNLHACAKAVVERHHGAFPCEESQLAALPGIGPYSAAAIAAIAFGARTAAIDANAERVLARLFAVEAQLPAAKPQLRSLAYGLLPPTRAGDFAQALMDLGASICTPKKPGCALCPWTQDCLARRRGDPESFPRKMPKAQGQLRRGAAFVLLRAERAILLRNRPLKGLLGGMAEVPTTAWSPQFDESTAVAQAPQLQCAQLLWRRLPGVVDHLFTHFPLRLSVYTAAIERGTVPAPQGMRWVALAELAHEALPTLMRKVIARAVALPPPP
ncbi:MAG TPA: A/G-specific adenine glycosylase [Xanthobacteraceae bacterium]|jgi:A/G-specific adenine glycosylase